MKIICLSVGKKHEPGVAEAISVYEKRLRAYVDFRFELIPPSEVHAESAAILKRISNDDYVILLDETGIQYDNPGLANLLADARNRSVRKLIIVIGGAYGVDDLVKSRSQLTISFSKLVFPHQLVRLMLTEQLYRSYNILAGGSYHHD